MIEFAAPQLGVSMSEYTKLPQLITEATAAIGFSISLGHKFIHEGISEIDDHIFPKLKEMLPEGVWPRVVPGYATLLWFTEQVKCLSKTK